MEQLNLSSELLSFFKDFNITTRKSQRNMTILNISLIIALLSAVFGFLIFLSSYEFESTKTYEANGIYAIVDSDGNVIAQDIDPETWEKFIDYMEDDN